MLCMSSNEGLDQKSSGNLRVLINIIQEGIKSYRRFYKSVGVVTF